MRCYNLPVTFILVFLFTALVGGTLTACSASNPKETRLGKSHWDEAASGIQVLGGSELGVPYEEDEIFIPDGRVRFDTVAAFPLHQPTSIAVSEKGKIFVSFPRWANHHRISVAVINEIGRLEAFPSRTWNEWQWGWNAEERFVSVQALWADGRGHLWVLDAASPFMQGTINGGPKLVQVDIDAEAVVKVYPLDKRVIPSGGYLQEVRVDLDRQVAYIAESGTGALIVLDLENGNAHRVLAEHPSLKAGNIPIKVGNNALGSEKGQTQGLHINAIELSLEGEYLYYQALTGRSLYRIPTEILRDRRASDSSLSAAVERIAGSVVSSGMAMDSEGILYLTSVEDNSIVTFNTETGAISTLLQHESMLWPEAMAFGPDGGLYIASSLFHLMPRFNDGKDLRDDAYRIFRLLWGKPPSTAFWP